MNNVDDDGDLIEGSRVITELVDLNPELSTYIIPELNSKYTKLLGRRPSIDKMLREYNTLTEALSQAYQQEREALIESLEDKMEEFPQNNSEFDEWLLLVI